MFNLKLLKQIVQTQFKNHFNLNDACTFYIHCPCSNCVKVITLLSHAITVANTLFCLIVPWSEIRVLVPSHLIALDKCLGVDPVGIRETL